MLYNILIYGRRNLTSKKFGKCPLNYCHKNMDRIEQEDEINFLPTHLQEYLDECKKKSLNTEHIIEWYYYTNINITNT